jgi:hypothetical protein
MKKTITHVILFAIVFGFSSCQNVAQKFLELTAEKYNKQCPMQINEFVRIDKCEAAPDLTLNYSMTILSLDGTENGEFQQESIKKAGKNNIIRELQKSPEFAKIKKLGIKYRYFYSDPKGKYLYDILITPDDYNNALPENVDEAIVEGLIASTKFEVQSMQKHLPTDMGNGVSMTAVRFIENERTNEYTATLTGELEKTAKADIDAYAYNTRLGLINSLKNNTAVLLHFTHGFTFRYIYNDSKGNHLFSVDITEDDI